jgi:hypothetical protein
MTLSVTTSSSVDVSTTLATNTDSDTATLNSYATEQTLLYSAVSDPSSDPLALVLGGEATAIGEDTLAAGSMSAELDTTGSLTTVEGSASFVAVADSPGDETAFATANSFGGVSGADFLLVFTSDTQIVDQGSDGSVAIAASDMMLYGLDFDSIAGDGSDETDPMLDPLAESELPATTEPTTDDDHLYDLAFDIEGNVAVLEVTAEVTGSDTLLEVGASVLTVEDTLSTVTGEIIAAVG